MAAMLQGSCAGTTFTITTEFGQWVLPNDQGKQNKKSLSVFLRAWNDPISGKPMCTSQQIADALGYGDRRDVNNFWREFHDCGAQFRDVLHRTLNVDAPVVEAVTEELRKDLLASAPT